MQAPWAVIFDMDNVLIKTKHHIDTYLKPLFSEFGADASALDFEGHEHHGKSLKDILGFIREQQVVDIDLAAFTVRANQASQEAVLADNPIAAPELVQLLFALQQSSAKIGLGTSSEHSRADFILAQLKISQFFQIVVASEDVAEHKPSPSLFLEVARRFGVEPKYCIVIEDAPNGIEAAHRAGMKAVAYCEFHGWPDQLSEADLVVKHWRELSLVKLKLLFGNI